MEIRVSRAGGKVCGICRERVESDKCTSCMTLGEIITSVNLPFPGLK